MSLGSAPTTPWQGSQTGGVRSYLAAIRSHRVAVLVVTGVTLLAAIAWIALRPAEYEATARMIVEPLSQENEDLFGLNLLRDAGDPTRTAQTAATLVDSDAAAIATAERLGGDWDREKVAEAVTVEPEGQSNILGITGIASSADEAAQLANTFVRSALAERNNVLKRQATSELERLRAEQDAQEDSSTQAAADLASKIDRYAAIAAGGDPTLRLSQAALPPDSSTGVSPMLLIPLALIAGLALAIGVAVLLEYADPRVRDEDELRTIYSLPVMVRTPTLSRRERAQAESGTWAMSPPVREAFRTILVQLEAGDPRHRTLMVTSASSGDGKTTSAINLALSIAASGHAVVLMDFDVRKPEIARSLGLHSDQPLHALLDPGLSESEFMELLTPAPHVPLLSVLSTGGGAAEPSLLDAVARRVPDLIAQARAVADYVVIDTPPLGEVSDALRIAHEVDAIILVARPGRTNRTHLEVTRDLLERAGRAPLGYLVVGGTPTPASTYYAHGLQVAHGDGLQQAPARGPRRAAGPR